MRKGIIGLVAAAVPLMTFASAATAAPWDGNGPMLAAFYNETMSIPKGWKLNYQGRQDGVEVFVFDSDFDSFPMTAMMSPDSQLRRVLCGDDTPKAWMAQGMRARADQRAKRGGKVQLVKGEVISRC